MSRLDSMCHFDDPLGLAVATDGDAAHWAGPTYDYDSCLIDMRKYGGCAPQSPVMLAVSSIGSNGHVSIQRRLTEASATGDCAAFAACVDSMPRGSARYKAATAGMRAAVAAGEQAGADMARTVVTTGMPSGRMSLQQLPHDRGMFDSSFFERLSRAGQPSGVNGGVGQPAQLLQQQHGAPTGHQYHKQQQQQQQQQQLQHLLFIEPLDPQHGQLPPVEHVQPQHQQWQQQQQQQQQDAAEQELNTPPQRPRRACRLNTSFAPASPTWSPEPSSPRPPSPERPTRGRVTRRPATAAAAARGKRARGDASPVPERAQRPARQARPSATGGSTSKYRGVTRHRRSGRFEAHLWVKDLGRQVYLGGYKSEEHAAEAYDVAALKCKGVDAVKTNFPLQRYADLLSCMESISLDELIMAVRRQSQGFSRGSSAYRGVTAHPSGRWESRIGIPGSKHIYLGLFEDERDAAHAYDRALVRLRGASAATNFALSDYKIELADYHWMQQAMLLEVGTDGTAISTDWERWVKNGRAGSSSASTASGSSGQM